MSILFAVASVALVLWVVYLLYRRSDIGLICLLAGQVFYIAFGPNAAVLGGLHIGPLDAVAFVLMFAGALRTLRSFRTLDLNRVIIFGYLAIFAISLARGIAAHGLTAAGNESRAFVGPLAGVLYFATAPVDVASVRRYTQIYLCFGFVLCMVAVASAAGLPVGMIAWNSAAIGALDGRYLPATGAAALAVCGFLSLAMLHYRRSGLIAKLLPVIFVGFAIYLRHRTVWMMLLAGMAALLFVDFRLFRRIIPFALVAAAAVALLAVYGSKEHVAIGEEQFFDSMSNGNTFMWRLNGWEALLLDDEQNALTVTIGKSVGSGFWRVDPTTYGTIEVAPHSEYVENYLRVGVVGAALILLFALRPLKRLWSFSKAGGEWVYPSASVWAIVVLMTLVYGFTYGNDPHLYALLGIANALAAGPAMEETDAVEGSEYDWTMQGIADASGEPA
ncbi:MAG: hypothetical protein P4L52_01380 [Acidocella sp.]|nr:hypothetical protein [Acidocella sp.]